MANNLAKDENSSKQDPRHIARILVLQFLFTKHRTSHFKEANNYEANILLNELEEQKFDNRLYEKLIEGVEENELLPSQSRLERHGEGKLESPVDCGLVVDHSTIERSDHPG